MQFIQFFFQTQQRKLNDCKVLACILALNQEKGAEKMKELLNNPKENEYLSEFRQKVAQEMQDDIEQRKRDLERSRNGFIGTITGIVLAVVVSWFFLLPHFGIGQPKEVPVIRRPVLPVKIQPSDPGGMEISNQDKTVYALVEKNADLNTKVESLLPPPETPQMPTIEPEEEKNVADEDILPEEAPSDMTDLIESVQTTATERVNIPQKLPAIEVSVAKAEPKDEPLKAVEKSVQAQKTDKDLVESESKSAAPQAAKFQVQLMALSKQEALEKGYNELVKKHPQLKNLPHNIKQGPQDKLYRLMVGAFETKDSAQKLCDELKKSGSSCLVKQN